MSCLGSMSIFSIWGHYKYFIVRLFTAKTQFYDAFSFKKNRGSAMSEGAEK